MTVPTTVARVWVTPTREVSRFLPEGPRSCARNGRAAVAWVNIQTAPDSTMGEILVRKWDEPGYETFPLPNRPGFLIPTAAEEHYLVGMGKELGFVDLPKSGDQARWLPIARIPDDNPRTIINDGEVTPDGRAVVFGTKDTKFADTIAALYLWTLDDNQITELAGGQTCSNGKIIHKDESAFTVWDIDTPRKVVMKYRLDLEHRTLRDEGIALDLRDRDDYPDGMCDGGDGTVIIAFYNPADVEAGEAVRYRISTGEVLQIWKTPGSPRVTCPLLVERDGKTHLILTTADEGMPSAMRAKSSNAGCLFVADV